MISLKSESTSLFPFTYSLIVLQCEKYHAVYFSWYIKYELYTIMTLTLEYIQIHMYAYSYTSANEQSHVTYIHTISTYTHTHIQDIHTNIQHTNTIITQTHTVDLSLQLIPVSPKMTKNMLLI